MQYKVHFVRVEEQDTLPAVDAARASVFVLFGVFGKGEVVACGGGGLEVQIRSGGVGCGRWFVIVSW